MVNLIKRLGVSLIISLAAALANADSNLKDPTKPYTFVPERISAPSPKKTLTVNYIKTSPAGAVAFINGQKVAVGDVVEGMRVSAISESGVSLKSGGRTVWVAFHSQKGITKK